MMEIINNNIAILDRHTRREARPGMWMLTFPGEYMPDGYDVEWAVKGQVTHKNLNEFCDVVRRTYDERINRNAAKETEPTDTRDTGSEWADPNAGVPARVNLPETHVVPTVEETLEAVLESQVLSLRDSLNDVETRITLLGGERTKLKQEVAKCEAALLAYKSATEAAPTPPARKRKTKAKAKPNPAKGAGNINKGDPE
jgi:hypothetical protein